MPISSKGIVIVHSRTQLLTGIFLLLLGSLVYVVDRSPDQVYFTRFFGIQAKMFDAGTPLLGSLGLRLPAFFHVLSFSLITGAFFRSGKGRYLIHLRVLAAGEHLFRTGPEIQNPGSETNA